MDDLFGFCIKFFVFLFCENLLKPYVKRKISEGTNDTQKQTKYKSK